MAKIKLTAQDLADLRETIESARATALRRQINAKSDEERGFYRDIAAKNARLQALFAGKTAPTLEWADDDSDSDEE